jgi:type I restriction enzyme, S subunit
MFSGLNLPKKTIGDLLDSGALLLHKDGNHGSLYPRADDFGDEGVPFLSAKALTDDGLIDNTLVEKLKEDKATRLKIGWIAKEDVLLAHNASVGKVAFYDGRFEKALIGTSLTAFRPNPEALDSRYLAAALRSPMFQHQLEKNMGQTTRNQVPITAQRKLVIVLPPLVLQQEFSRRVTVVEKLKAVHKASLAKLDELFASLQYRAFRGNFE